MCKSCGTKNKQGFTALKGRTEAGGKTGHVFHQYSHVFYRSVCGVENT